MALPEQCANYDKINAALDGLGFPGINSSAMLWTRAYQPVAIPDAERVIPFIEEAFPTTFEMVKSAPKYSLQEYLGIAMLAGLQALHEGNYGIGAVYVLNHGGWEYIVTGRNKLRTSGNSSKHAEMDAIDAIESLRNGEQEYAGSVICRRRARDGEDRKLLVTSLDPCPMCRVRIQNHIIPIVLVGNPDPLAGSMIGDNVSQMPPLWPILMEKQGIQAALPNTTNPKDPLYVNPKYLPMIHAMFELNREAIDHEMGEIGFGGNTPAIIAEGIDVALQPIESAGQPYFHFGGFDNLLDK